MHTVRDIMTPAPITLPLSATVADAAREMRDADRSEEHTSELQSH